MAQLHTRIIHQDCNCVEEINNNSNCHHIVRLRNATGGYGLEERKERKNVSSRMTW